MQCEFNKARWGNKGKAIPFLVIIVAVAIFLSVSQAFSWSIFDLSGHLQLKDITANIVKQSADPPVEGSKNVSQNETLAGFDDNLSNDYPNGPFNAISNLVQKNLSGSPPESNISGDCHMNDSCDDGYVVNDSCNDGSQVDGICDDGCMINDSCNDGSQVDDSMAMHPNESSDGEVFDSGPDGADSPIGGINSTDAASEPPLAALDEKIGHEANISVEAKEKSQKSGKPKEPQFIIRTYDNQKLSLKGKIKNLNISKNQRRSQPAQRNQEYTAISTEYEPGQDENQSNIGHEDDNDILIGQSLENNSRQVYMDLELSLEDSPLQKIEFRSLALGDEALEVGIDDAPEDIAPIAGRWEEVYAIDPSMLDFSDATVTVTATGNRLYKCRDWDYSNRMCSGEWEFLKDIRPGENYTFVLSPDDPGFGEIIAVDALHLDENYSFISEIYDQISQKDDIWSGPVREGEYVRVYFESPLKNGSMIDVYARSNGTMSYFEVYEGGTDQLVGRSGIIEYPELIYVPVHGLSAELDVFDLKVVKVYLNLWELDNTTNIDPEVDSYLEFDYIHDDAISLEHAGGMVAYQELNIQSPRYRIWNASEEFTAELTDTLSVGADIYWTTLAASHERDEMILGTEDISRKINMQIFSPERIWTSAIELSTDAPNAAYRSFDIAYEDLSGDALIVYESSSVSDNVINYVIWNGSGYSAQQSFVTPVSASTFNWVTLSKKHGSDDMMLVLQTSGTQLYAVPWNGTEFDTSKGTVVTSASASSTEQHFSFAWESQSGDGLIAYGAGTDLVTRTYADSTGTWGSESLIGLGPGQQLDALRQCADTGSDHIGIIVQDSGNDVLAIMWNGSEILPGYPSEDGSTEPNGANNINCDCAWAIPGEIAFFGFVDFNALAIDYFTFNRSANSWSLADLTAAPASAEFASDDIAGLRFTKHPTKDLIMITAMDLVEDITMIMWNITGFISIAQSPVEVSTEVSNGQQEGVMFEWDRYDPNPAVKDIIPQSGQSFSMHEAVQITVNVTDNIAVGSVFANISLQNGTYYLLEMEDADEDLIYNLTFSETQYPGAYTIRIIANDTSIHDNLNASESVVIDILDLIRPSVYGLSPSHGSVFNTSTAIEIAANASDNHQLDSISANITGPYGLAYTVQLVGDGQERFNATFIIPGTVGEYTVLFICNDSSGNMNSTESISFNATDTEKPAVTAISPPASSLYDPFETIIISASISDSSGIDKADAEISYPNGTTSIISLADQGADIYSNLLIAPALLGQYNISFFANDSNGNINSTTTASFNVTDTKAPSVSIQTPTLLSIFSQNQSVSITAQVTDHIDVAYVRADMTLPDMSIQSRNMTDDDSNGIYNATFNGTEQIGTYILRIFANDSEGNVNNSMARSFLVQDSGSPAAYLISPQDGFTATSRTIIFTCNATDNAGLANITLLHNISQAFGESQTNNISGLSNHTNFSISDIADGSYAWNCLVVDNSGNPTTGPENFSLDVDATPPAVLDAMPLEGSSHAYGATITIQANVTDASAVTSVAANITYPNSTVAQITLTDGDLDEVYENSFTIPAVTGSFHVVFYASDTNGNINNSVTANFLSEDTIDPAITVMACSPQTAVLGAHVNCSAIIADAISLDSVSAAVTLPDATILAQSISSDAGTYTFTYSEGASIGNHTVAWTANDTSSNLATGGSYFMVIDNMDPTVIIHNPVAALKTTSPTLNLSFTATDNFYQSFNCSIFVNGMINSTHTVSSGVRKDVTMQNISQGSYTWKVRCIDGSSNTGESVQRAFTRDISAPQFLDFLIEPDTEDELDPGTLITVSAEVSDALTGVDTVILKYRLSNASHYTNITMAFNASTGLYAAAFIPTAQGTYNIKLFANDTLNNSDFTNDNNVTVEYDMSWTRSPSAFNVVGSLHSNVMLGNLTISNTGDDGLNFTITSNSAYTAYDPGPAVWLEPGEQAIIGISDYASQSGINSITLNISTDAGDPQYRKTDALIITSTGEPILLSTFTVPSAEELSAYPDTSNIQATARLDNIGDSSAFNGTFFFTLPAGWTVTFGEYLMDFEEIQPGDHEEHTIYFSVPPDAIAGRASIYANSTCVNPAGHDISADGLIIGDKVDVVVLAKAVVQGGGSGDSPPAPSGGEPSIQPPAPVTDTSDSGSKTAEVADVPDRQSLDEDDIYSSDSIIEVMRGDNITFPIEIVNPYTDMTIHNITAESEGVYANYMQISPEILSSLGPGQTGIFTVRFHVPAYRQKEEIELRFLITGTAWTTEIRSEGGADVIYTIRKNIIETKTVRLLIREVSVDDTADYGLTAQQAKEILDQRGIASGRIDAIIADIGWAIGAKDYELASQHLSRLIKLRDEIISADDMIKDLKDRIAQAKKKGLDVSQTEKILELAESAFAREDYGLALKRAKEAELTESFETKGAFNIINFITRFWWAIILSAITCLIASMIIYNRFMTLYIEGRIEQLTKEEAILYQMISELQESAFKNLGEGMSSYHKKMYEYEKRSAEIKRLKSNLRIKKLGLTDPITQMKNLGLEHERIISQIRDAQEGYFNRKDMSRKNYDRLINELNLRLIEMEEASAIVKTKLAKDKIIDPETFELIRKANTDGSRNVYIRTKFMLMRLVSRLSGIQAQEG